jgi:lysophospholipase L1-like esterase
MITPVAGVVGFIGDSITAAHNVETQYGPVPLTASLLSGLSLSSLTYVGLNLGVDGTASGDWLTGGSNYNIALGYFVSNGCGIVCIEIGTNDSATAIATTKDVYKANVLNLMTGLFSQGVTQILLNKPIWVTPTGSFDSNSNTLIGQYGDALVELYLENPTQVFLGDRQAYNFFQANPDLLEDGVHPTQVGYSDLANFWEIAYTNAFLEDFGLSITKTGMFLIY